MKKTLLIFFILFTVRAYSQTISYGISAGLNYTNASGNGNPNTTLLYSISNSYQTGFHVGGLIDIKFQSFSIQPGVLFTTMGGQNKWGIPNNGDATYTGGSEKINLDYIQIPVNFLYRLKAGSGNVFIGGGPYIGIGTSGKYSYTENLSGGVYRSSESLTFGNNFPLKNPDIGINALEGYQFKLGLAISAGYSFGLTDAYNTGANNKNKGFNFSVAYFF